ncbi:hypothetical protein ACTHS7_13765, partial [Neisseria sp. P0015.S009]|uniref:hypothetical protein n=1 Tax=Neisseria sp. P0015.S009 TaxID=3436765 RepID=UPI003F7FFE0B
AGLLWLAYDLVNPILVKDGWVYDAESKNWVRYDNLAIAGSLIDLPIDESLFIEDVCDSGNYQCDVKHLFRKESYSVE